jgi:hypothetical protein
MRRLSSDDRTRRFAHARELWNEFDPIGVVHAVSNEYDNYIDPCLRILENGGGVAELRDYVSFVVFEQIGLNQTDALTRAIHEFAEGLASWYVNEWERPNE